MDKKHQRIKKTLQVIGIVSTTLAFILAIIALMDFFGSMNGLGQPEYFWLFFVASPLAFVGIVCLTLGYKKEITRYHLNEDKENIKDVQNYLHEGTRNEIVKTVKEIKNEVLTCPHCLNKVEKNDKFCPKCGKPLVKICPKCHEENSLEDNYCSHCGNKLS